MTPLESSEEIVRRFIPAHITAVDRQALTAAIHHTVCTATNEELERRRDCENQLAGIKTSGVVVVCTEERTFLKVWNPQRKRWYETNMIEVSK